MDAKKLANAMGLKSSENLDKLIEYMPPVLIVEITGLLNRGLIDTAREKMHSALMSLRDRIDTKLSEIDN